MVLQHRSQGSGGQRLELRLDEGECVVDRNEERQAVILHQRSGQADGIDRRTEHIEVVSRKHAIEVGWDLDDGVGNKDVELQSAVSIKLRVKRDPTYILVLEGGSNVDWPILVPDAKCRIVVRPRNNLGQVALE